MRGLQSWSTSEVNKNGVGAPVSKFPMGNCEARLADGEAANEGHDSAFKLAGIKAEEGLQAQLEKTAPSGGWLVAAPVAVNSATFSG